MREIIFIILILQHLIAFACDVSMKFPAIGESILKKHERMLKIIKVKHSSVNSISEDSDVKRLLKKIQMKE